MDEKFVSSKLIGFLIDANRSTYAHIEGVLAQVKTLQLILAELLSPEQVVELKELEEDAHDALVQIVQCRSIANNVIRLLHHPTDLTWEEINMLQLVENAIERYTSVVKGVKFKEIQPNTEPMLVHGPYPLIAEAVQHFVRLGYLLATSEAISCSLLYSEIEIGIRIFGSKFSESYQASDKLQNFSKTVTTNIVLILGGRVNWDPLGYIRDVDQLELYLPKDVHLNGLSAGNPKN